MPCCYLGQASREKEVLQIEEEEEENFIDPTAVKYSELQKQKKTEKICKDITFFK